MHPVREIDAWEMRLRKDQAMTRIKTGLFIFRVRHDLWKVERFERGILKEVIFRKTKKEAKAVK